MSRLQSPLIYRMLSATGDVLLRAKLILAIKTRQNRWQHVPFLVDSGSEMTTMAAVQAKRLDVPMPLRAAVGVIHRPSGLEVRPGILRAQIVGMDQTEYAFPCFFVGDPDLIPPHPQLRSPPTELLGLSGVIDKLRITFDGDAGPGAPYGHIIVERK